MQIVGIGVTATVIIAVLKVQRPDLALQISVITGIIIFLIVAGKLAAAISLMRTYASRSNLGTAYFSTLLKITGIAYITQFGAEACRDAGEGAIASKIELAGKSIIIVAAMPIITSLLDLVMKIMP